MADTPRPPRAPAGLGTAGKRFWSQSTAIYGFDSRDLAVLELVCRTLDELEGLQHVLSADGPMSTGAKGQPVANPILTQIRQHRLLLDRLMTRLALPAAAGEPVRSVSSLRSQHAGNVRWARERARRERDAG